MNLPSLQIIDLSSNSISYVEKMMFSSSIQPVHSHHSDSERPVKIFLQGKSAPNRKMRIEILTKISFSADNSFNCTRHLKWMALRDLKFDISDKHVIQCVDNKYKGRPLITVMNFKLVSGGENCSYSSEIDSNLFRFYINFATKNPNWETALATFLTWDRITQLTNISRCTRWIAASQACRGFPKDCPRTQRLCSSATTM